MTTRQEIEINVCAVNSALKSKVEKMTLIELLRNCHPSPRSDWARKLYKDKQLTKEEANEFTKIL
jgi:hypothetical protein